MELNPMNADLDRLSSESLAQLPLQAQTVGESFAAVVENMVEAFFALDLTGRCTYLNVTAERLLGATRTDLLGKIVWNIFQVDPLSQLCQQCQQAISNSQYGNSTGIGRDI